MSVIAASDSEALQTWRSTNSRLQIRFPASLLRAIDAQVVAGFSTFRRGGVEVGGVLFGTHDASGVTLSAFRPIACEHRFGPAFQLSDTDQEQLRELLERDPEADPELSELEPVGWFHSHTRTSIDLTEQDAYFHTKHFGKPWQIAVVLRPEQLRPTRIAFYVPEEDGRLRPAPAEDTLEISNRAAVSPMTADTAIAVVPAPVDIDVPPGPARVVKSRRAIVAACALFVGIIAAAVYTSVADGSASKPMPDISLRIVGVGEQLTIAWVPPEGSHSADLEIRDGISDPQFVHLSAQQLEGGRLSYVRRAPDVNVRMRVYGSAASPADFVASFLGPPIRKPQVVQATVETPAAPNPPPPVEAAGVPMQLQQRARTEPLAAKAFAEAPVLQAAATPPPSPALAPPPAIEVNPDLGSAPPTLTPAPARVLTPPPAAPAPVVQARPPASGRAIWTGLLAPGATLTFANGRASSGNLTGRWPQTPARISAHVADLSDAGIIVYTNDAAQRSRVGTSEAPAARNGWNATTWRWDERRGGSVRVLEAPGPQNGWNRLTVRGDGRKVSVIILEWEELPAPASR